MYIPVMSLVTYIFLQALISGLRGQFQPELFGYIATTALVVVIVEILGLKLGCYLLSISNQSQLLDLVAYSGYKFVGVIVTITVAEVVNGGKGTGGWVGWTVFIYTFLANSLFLVSLSYPFLMSSRDGWLTLYFTDAVTQVRSLAREQWRQQGPHADDAPARFAGEEEPADAVPVLLLVYRPALLHVDSLPVVNRGWTRV